MGLFPAFNRVARGPRQSLSVQGWEFEPEFIGRGVGWLFFGSLCFLNRGCAPYRDTLRLQGPRTLTRRSAGNQFLAGSIRAKLNAVRKFRAFAAHGSPGGTSENSPAFQRRETGPEVLSPAGTAEIMRPTGRVQSSLRDFRQHRIDPALKRRAIL